MSKTLNLIFPFGKGNRDTFPQQVATFLPLNHFPFSCDISWYFSGKHNHTYTIQQVQYFILEKFIQRNGYLSVHFPLIAEFACKRKK